MASHRREVLRLLTLNTWKCDGAYHQRMNHLEQSLRKLRPDIICCQEVFQSQDGRYHTGRFLAGRLGMQVQSLAIRKKRRRLGAVWMESCSGLAVLSSRTVARHTAVCLPTLPEDGDRYALFAVIETAAHSILVINTHLSHLPGAVNLRIAQLETILSQPGIGGGHDAVFLCGDFNATPESAEAQYLRHYPDLLVTDALARFAHKGPMVTFSPPGSPAGVLPQSPGKRIDYVFGLSRSAADRPRIVDARVVLDQPAPDGVYASDHYGVIIETRLDPGDH